MVYFSFLRKISFQNTEGTTAHWVREWYDILFLPRKTLIAVHIVIVDIRTLFLLGLMNFNFVWSMPLQTSFESRPYHRYRNQFNTSFTNWIETQFRISFNKCFILIHSFNALTIVVYFEFCRHLSFCWLSSKLTRALNLLFPINFSTMRFIKSNLIKFLMANTELNHKEWRCSQRVEHCWEFSTCKSIAENLFDQINVRFYPTIIENRTQFLRNIFSLQISENDIW